MSDLLNSASLVMVPSGYKEDTVYSVVPSDGSGDLSFTRASNGTRVNSAGLVEVVPWNLLEYSENLNDSSWTKYDISVTANAGVAPNGTTTADKVIPSTSTTNHLLHNTPFYSSLGDYTMSVYIKADGYSKVAIRESWSVGFYASFDLTLGTIIDSSTAQINTITPVGNGWYRLTTSRNFVGDIVLGIIPLQNSYTGGNPLYAYAGDGTSGVLAWGAQINIGSTAKPYFPTTDRLNVPRLTYQNGGGGCPSLLLEKQSTNLMTYSQDFTQWTIIRASLGANTTAPNGVNDGYSIIANTTNDDHFVMKDVSVVNTTVYSYTAFLKKGNKSWARLWNTSVGYADFDLENGVVGTQSSAVGSIQSFGNGWYRCSIVYTANSTGNNYHRIYTLNGDNSRIFAGDGSTINLYMFGAQLEASSYPTSYIPTTSSSATRVADVATVNLPNTNMTFTAYLECEEAPLATTAGDWFYIYSNVSILGRAFGWANTFGFADAYSLGVASGTKMVWKQESGSTAKIFKGGSLVGTSTTGTYTDPFNRLRIDGAFLDKPVKIKQFVFFDNALTDAECIQLTA